MSEPAKKADLEQSYAVNENVYLRLAEEVTFSLERELTARGIELHSVGSRVKELESLRQKADRLGLSEPLSEVRDIVGVRVVVLFLSDLPRVEKVLSELFEIVEQDNKLVDQDPSSFGYFSVHYVAKLRSDHRGPRYDELQGITFEVQTRTIVMDAWASVSHHLDYKGETSVPRDLRRDFYALSGLFYVADQHFEIFASQSQTSQEEAEKEIKSSGINPEANLHTVAALLANVFPDREEARRDGISEFVEEIAKQGYTQIRQLESQLRIGAGAVVDYEQDHPPHSTPGRRYNRVGAARHALAIADPAYAAAKYPSEKEDLADRHAKHRG